MSDGITKWLEQLGLSEFDELFAEQKVVYDDLRDLTDTDLKDLGVPLGPRKRLLRATSQLQTDRESTDVAAQSPSSTTSETKEAERRQACPWATMATTTSPPKNVTTNPSAP